MAKYTKREIFNVLVNAGMESSQAFGLIQNAEDKEIFVSFDDLSGLDPTIILSLASSSDAKIWEEGLSFPFHPVTIHLIQPKGI